MQIAFNLLVLLLIVIISQAFFASGLLVFSIKNKLPSRILAVLIFVIALWLTDHFMRTAMIYRQYPNLYFLPIFYSLSFGPLLYFYVRSLTNHQFRFRRIHLLHFIPVFLQAGLYIFLTCTDYSFKQWYWENVHKSFTYRLEFDGTWISLTIYLLLSYRLLHKYQLWLVENFSEISRIRLNWLKIILAALLVLCVQWLVEVILRDVAGLYFRYDYTIELLGIIALILGVAGWQQANLAAVNYEGTAEGFVEFKADEKLLAQITEILETEKLYLNPTLSLVEFSKAVKVNPKIISRQINGGFGKSFNELINSYRVAEVKRRLKTPDLNKLTLLGIAYDSGFNSKTTFNRIFKDFTGVVPSDYVKQLDNN